MLWYRVMLIKKELENFNNIVDYEKDFFII